MHRQNILFLMAIIGITACGRSIGSTDSVPAETLARMRADSAWILELDSLATEALGPGARCIDPAWHLFEWDGRKWLFNQDWGGVLEIPSGYTPEDDLWQAELSFHGTRAFSPDSTVIISFYAGFQGIGNDERIHSVTETLQVEGFSICSIEMSEEGFRVSACNGDGVRYFARYLFADGDGVEYTASVQYPEGMEEEADRVIQMLERFPLGPDGRRFRGLAL